VKERGQWGQGLGFGFLVGFEGEEFGDGDNGDGLGVCEDG
jgi:hypothetical protein